MNPTSPDPPLTLGFLLVNEACNRQIIEANPAHAVKAAKYVVKKGKTPVLKAL